MRLLICSALLAISACAIPPILGSRGDMTASTYAAADASTSLLVGDQLAVERFVSNEGAEQGMDPLVRLTLRHADGRTMSFTASNHTPHDVMAQAAGGPLAQIMGLMGEEAPALYAAESAESANAFFCAPNGPSNIGVYEASDDTVLVVGMLQSIEFETRVDGSVSALPYSPDQVCARLRFRRG